MNRSYSVSLAALLAGGLLTTSASAEVNFSGYLWAPNGDLSQVFIGFDGSESGPGSLAVSDPDSVNISFLYVGANSLVGTANTVVVSGGSLITDSFEGYIGTLEISGTGTVTSGSAFLSDGGPETTFVATVSGGSWINASSITLGRQGSGTLTISGTGLVESPTVTLGQFFTPTSTVNLNGGILRAGQVHLAVGTGTVAFNGGKLQLSANQAALFSGMAPGTVTLSGAGGTIDTQEFTVATAHGLTGDGALTKQGSGTLTLTGANTYTGGTTVAEGTLQIGAGGTSGSVAGNIVNNGALVFDRSDALIYAGIISGTGSLTKNGVGVLTLTNLSTYTGATAVNAGTLAIDGAVTGPGGLVTVANGATLGGSGKLYRDVSVGATGQVSSSLNIFGQVTLANQSSVGDVSSGTTTAGAGQQLVIGNATGGTINTTAGTASIATLNGANLQTGNLGATVETLAAGNITTNGGALVAKGGNFAGTISGSGGLTKAGPGTLTLTGASDYTGGTFVAGGLILVNNSSGSGLGSGEVAVGGGGTLGGSGIISGPTAIGSGGTLSPGNSPGRLTFESSLTLGGGSNTLFQIDGTDRGNTYDAIDVGGLTTYGGTLNLVFGGTISSGSTLDLFGLGGGSAGDFDFVTGSGAYAGSFVNTGGVWTLTSGGQTLTFSESTGDLSFTGSAIPEPSSAAVLAGLAALGLGGRRRRLVG